MPPKDAARLDAIPPTTTLALQDWLKLLNTRGVDMRVAMGLAAKMYNSHNTKERLESLDGKKLSSVIPDKEARRTVVNAVKGITSGQPMVKKRNRDSDLLNPLEEGQEDLPESLDFHPILDPEELIPISITVNRSPVKTALAYTVAIKLGFDVQEALSIAHVYVHLSSLKHALMLGNILNKDETREAQDELSELPGDDGKGRWYSKPEKKRKSRPGDRDDEEEHRKAIGSSQPWVGILRAKIPVIERPDGTWRAIQKGIPVQPSVAYLYITRAFKKYTPHIMGALKLLADSYSPDELNRLGMHMYNTFKPEVENWGERATLECAKILNQMKVNVTDDVEELARLEAANVPAADSGETNSLSKPISTAIPSSDPADTDSVLSEPPEEAEAEDDAQPPRKKQMTVEEYEAMLDAEDAEGGFLEAGDIALAR